MNDALVLILKGEEINYIQKDEKVVDSFNELCIMPYLQAAQLEGSYKNTHKTKLMSCKDLLALSNNTDGFIKQNARKYFSQKQE